MSSGGGISYSGLTNYGKASLPAVEDWGNSKHLIKDPPKSVTARYKEKVGDTSVILAEMARDDDRIADHIRPFARGVNPMVRVSYNNHGNNGGQFTGGMTTLGYDASAKLPYRIMDGGAFRPPIKKQEDLLPLSRLPRKTTSVQTQSIRPDYSKRLFNTENQSKTAFPQIKSSCLHTSVTPTAVYKVQKSSLKEPFEVIYAIQSKRTTSVITNPAGHQESSTKERKFDKRSEIIPEKLRVKAHTNPKLTKATVQTGDINTSSHMQQTIQTSSRPTINASLISGKSTIDEIVDMNDISVKDVRTTSVIAPISGVTQTKHIHSDIQLARNLPEYSYITNTGDHRVHKKIPYETEIELARNIPEHSCVTNTGDHRVHKTIPHETEIELARNIPEHSCVTNTGDHRVHKKIPHEREIELTRNIPEHSYVTNTRDHRVHKKIPHEREIELKRRTPLVRYQTNPRSYGEDAVSTREIRLRDKIQPGSFHLNPMIPTLNPERAEQPLRVTQRQKLAERVNNELFSRR
jgi:hypothetical protein